MAERRVTGVTALIAVLDGERFLSTAIESALAQTIPCAQVIVVDNGSEDRSGEIAAEYSPAVTVVEEPERGIGPARNAGLAAARGDYVAILDHDDIWEPHKNEVQLRAFERDPGLDLVFGHVRQFADRSYDSARHGELWIPSEPQPGLFLPAMLAPRSVWRRVGPWRADVGASDGLEWLLRARALGLREEMLPETVVRRRVHDSNQSRLDAAAATAFTRHLKRSIDARRRRAAR